MSDARDFPCCDADPTPAYVPQVGDRVRVVVEGEIKWSSLPGWMDIESGEARHTICAREAVLEKLPDPLPTTPGSVVRDYVDNLYALNANREWVGLSTGKARSLPGAGPHTVEHDAGATR